MDETSSAAPAAELPGIAEWLVDGFNVLHAGLLRGRDRKAWWNEERRRLVVERAEQLAARGERVCVVFDGARPALAETEPSAAERASAVRVVFARDADEWILKTMRAAADPGAVAVVTADRSVADRARRWGAHVVSPRAFLARCAEEAGALAREVVSARPSRTLRGSCHCRAVRFEVTSDFPELTTCDCSICRRKNALMVRVHESSFRLLAGEESLSAYRFHTCTATHYFCRVCGIYPFHRKRVTPDHYGVNVLCLEGFDPAGIPVRATVGAGMP